MKIAQHLVVSLCISGLVWAWLASFTAALACLFGGVLIDLDHVIDYYWQYKRLRPRHFIRAFEFEIFANIFVFLHSWELVVLYLAILWLLDWKPVALGFVIGVVTHLLLDHLVNAHSPLAYFLTYRLWHRFSGKHFYGARDYRRRLKHARNKAGRQGAGQQPRR